MRVINEVCTGEFDKSYEWDQVPIMVPPVVPSGLSHCNIMLVGYRIQVLSILNSLPFFSCLVIERFVARIISNFLLASSKINLQILM